MSVLIPRNVRHPNAPGKSLLPTLTIGTPVLVGAADVDGAEKFIISEFPGIIVAARRRAKFARRYLVAVAGIDPDGPIWLRRDQFTVGGATNVGAA